MSHQSTTIYLFEPKKYTFIYVTTLLIKIIIIIKSYDKTMNVSVEW